jgi:hypothetical protein
MGDVRRVAHARPLQFDALDAEAREWEPVQRAKYS